MKRLLLLFWLVASALQAGTEKFSDSAWKRIEPIYQEIKAHPFNQQLAAGTLPKEKFDYYKTQDAIYLPQFAKSISVLGKKIENFEEGKTLFQVAVEGLEEELEGQKKIQEKNPPVMPFTLFYSNLLLATAAYKSREELAASLLPCYWIYLRLAEDLIPSVSEKSAYYDWFQAYSSPGYKKSVDAMRHLTDLLAVGVKHTEREKMLQAFEMASRMEWYFWEGAFHQIGWKP